MSNTEFVMLPRELVARIARAGCWPNDEDELRKVLAEQPQDDPVALPARKPSRITDARAEGWNACLDEIAKIGPLYAHADPAEVERLREEIKHLRDGWYEDESDNSRYWPEQLQEAKSELADRDALLQDLLDYDISTNARRRIEEALSASPVPEVKS